MHLGWQDLMTKAANRKNIYTWSPSSLGILTAWQFQGNLTSYMVAQGSKSSCSSEKRQKELCFLWLSLKNQAASLPSHSICYKRVTNPSRLNRSGNVLERHEGYGDIAAGIFCKYNMPQKLRFKEVEWLAEAEQLVKPILDVWLEDSICDLQIIAQSLQQNKWNCTTAT